MNTPDQMRTNKSPARSRSGLSGNHCADALLRASWDALPDSEALLEGIRGSGGKITDFHYRDANRAMCTHLGMTREELIGRTALETMPNLGPTGLLARYAECADTHAPLVLDGFGDDNWGSADEGAFPRRYDIRANYVGGDLIIVSWRGVTERREDTHRISESENRYRLLAENVDEVVVRLDDDGKIGWISQSSEKTLGAAAGQYVGRRLLDNVTTEDRPKFLAQLDRASRGQSSTGRVRVLAADGTPHWMDTSVKPLYDAGTKRDGTVVTLRMVDKEVAAESAAANAREHQAAAYQRLMENSAVGMCLVTRDGQFQVVNQALCDFLGHEAEALQQMTWQEVTAPDSLAEDLANVEEVLAGHIDHYRLTKQYIHADGRQIWGDLSVSCLRDTEGRVEYFVSQIIDITAQVETRRQVALREERNQALTQRLKVQTDKLQEELTVAAAYVKSVLPGDLGGPVPVSQRYLPSRELSGDCFDYRWLDDDHLMVYLLDVSGHGIAPALVSMSVHNLMRSGSQTTETRKLRWLLEPGEVLAELNAKFPMDQHGGNYFTMWYGLYQASTRTLRYASAGHPPALVLGDSVADPVQLASQGFPIGMFADAEFRCGEYQVPPGAEILLYSDGAYELPHPEGGVWSLPDFIGLCSNLAGSPDWNLDELADRLRARSAAGLFEDDCSLVLMRFE